MTALLAGPAPRSRRARLLIGLLALLLAAALVAGCNQVQEQAGNVVEHAIEEAIEGLELTDGVPPGFPGEDVPLVEGPIRGASKTDADGQATWVALVDAEDSGESARQALLDADFEVTHTVTTDAGVLAQLASETFTVKLIASTSRVVYVVTPS